MTDKSKIQNPNSSERQNTFDVHCTLPDKVNRIIDILNNAGYEAYAVGGCVRDSVLGKTPKDFDVTTSAKPEEIKSLFKRTVDTGIKHGTVTVLIGDDSYEVTTYRIDCDYEDMRHPKDVIFTDKLTEDLKRRDFTINAMAYSDKSGLIDEFGGMDCIDKKIIKAVGNAGERLNEDALRILRALRFSAELDYAIDDELKTAIRNNAGNLSKISAERICTELIKLVMSDHPERLKDAYDLSVLKVILPELDLCFDTPQNTPHHNMNVGDHTVKALINLNEYRDEFTDRENRILRLAMLLHDIGKPEVKTAKDGIDHFKMHPEAGERLAEKVMRRLRLDNDTIINVKKLILHHDRRPKLTMPVVRKLIVEVGALRMPMYQRLRRADVLAHSDYMLEEKLAYLDELDAKVKKVFDDNDCISVKNLAVNGNDLMQLGIPEGPMLGKALDSLFCHVLDEPGHNDKDYLINFARKNLISQQKDTV